MGSLAQAGGVAGGHDGCYPQEDAVHEGGD